MLYMLSSTEMAAFFREEVRRGRFKNGVDVRNGVIILEHVVEALIVDPQFSLSQILQRLSSEFTYKKLQKVIKALTER